MRTLILLLTLLLPASVCANWFKEHNVDKFDGVETHRTWGFGNIIGEEFTSYGIRCDSRSKLLLTLGFVTELENFNAPIDVVFKVDGNDPIHLEGKLFSNSKKSGFVRADKSNISMINQLILQSRKGRVIDIRVSNVEQSQFVEYSVPLYGFSKFSKATRSACSVGSVRMEMTPEDKAELVKLNQQLKETKQRIADLEAKYSTGF
ncbi:hypothetical protein L1D34_23340 [Vibrio mediterranei]|uniref:hypothetical protein n=1 Tax=Vibrio mediterranei TaxID=689 RepID=UPI001EFC61A8|nr:hypothetical protein [Vibrio mediterranei]MCG9627772.1 hypothetical protein [Vibrio mediterranei]